MKHGLGLLLLATGIATAAPAPQDFARYAPLQTQDAAALYRAALNADVYRHATEAGLGDMRVFNGQGEIVPHALEPMPLVTRPPSPISVPFFAEARSATTEGRVAVSVEARADGTLVSVQPGRPVPLAGAQRVLVDASGVKRPLARLDLDWAEARFQGQLRLEASDDLQSWRAIAEAELLRLQQGGQRLERRSISFEPTTARYLRLQWSGAAPTLTAVRVVPQAEAALPARVWLSPQPVDDPDGYHFVLANVAPADRLRIRLPQTNTVAQVTIEARFASNGPWHPIARARLYRLQQDGAEARNGDLMVPARIYREWRVRVDGGKALLGTGQPTLQIGWVPQQLVWLARGQPPFLLGYGQRDLPTAAGGNLSVAGAQPGNATLGPARDGTPQPEPWLAGDTMRRWVLWAVLLLAVAVLGGMAWRLARRSDGM